MATAIICMNRRVRRKIYPWLAHLFICAVIFMEWATGNGSINFDDS